MNNSSQTPRLSFDFLKLKYQVINPPYKSFLIGVLEKRAVGTELNLLEKNLLKNSGFSESETQDYSSSNPLYQILTRVELGGELSQVDIDWLTKERLFETIAFIRTEQNKKNQLKNQLKRQLDILKKQYKISTYLDSDSDIPLLQILKNIECLKTLSDSEVNWLKTENLLQPLERYQKQELQKLAREQAEQKRIAREQEAEQKRIAREQEAAKERIKAEKHYTILKQLETGKRLNSQDGEWLKKHQFLETLGIFQEREAVQRNELSQLQDKYKASKHQDLSTSNKLYKILQKLESKQKLIQVDIDWLKKQGLTDTIAIAEEIQEQKHFAALKSKYQATQYEDSSLSSPLYQILKKLDSGKQPSNAEVNWLSNHSLNQVIEIAKERESQKHFTSLRAKYNVSDYKDKSPSSNLYLILQKLEKQERLEATDVAWLTENKLFYPNEKITIEYHKIEANFYEQEFYRTKNGWNLPSASSHWRKADESQTALKLTDNLDWDMIKDKKLKSALLTTRGGAYRDIQQLNKAEKCAKGAIEYQPDSHHPYTLMGAICYERGQYLEGDSWFNEAIKRGANPRDMDSEIKRVVRNAKNENKRREVVEFLLKKDPSRYAWAKAYLKKPQNKSL